MTTIATDDNATRDFGQRCGIAYAANCVAGSTRLMRLTVLKNHVGGSYAGGIDSRYFIAKLMSPDVNPSLEISPTKCDTLYAQFLNPAGSPLVSNMPDDSVLAAQQPAFNAAFMQAAFSAAGL